MQFLHIEQTFSLVLSGSYIMFILNEAQDVAFFVCPLLTLWHMRLEIPTSTAKLLKDNISFTKIWF